MHMPCFALLFRTNCYFKSNPGVRYRVDPLWLLGGLPVIHLRIMFLQILPEV